MKIHDLLLCRRHHRAVHEGRVKVSVNRDGTVLFVTPKGRMLVDAPRRPGAVKHRDAPAGMPVADLPPVPSAHPGAPAKGDGTMLSNGAALYRDSEIPWEVEAAALEAIEKSLG